MAVLSAYLLVPVVLIVRVTRLASTSVDEPLRAHRCPEVRSLGLGDTRRIFDGSSRRWLSRATFFMSIFGYTLARGGRATEAYQRLAELDERALCGEFIPALSRLGICMRLGDADGVRREANDRRAAQPES